MCSNAYSGGGWWHVSVRACAMFLRRKARSITISVSLKPCSPQSKEGTASVCGRPGLSAALLYLVPSVPSRAEAT